MDEVKVKTTKLKLTPEQIAALEHCFGKDFANKLKEITVADVSGRLEIVGNSN